MGMTEYLCSKIVFKHGLCVDHTEHVWETPVPRRLNCRSIDGFVLSRASALMRRSPRQILACTVGHELLDSVREQHSCAVSSVKELRVKKKMRLKEKRAYLHVILSAVQG